MRGYLATKLNLRFQIAGHKQARVNAIKRAVTELIHREGLHEDFSKMRRILGDDLEVLHFRTLRPIRANGTAHAWVRKLRKDFRLAILEANRGKCDVSVQAEYMRDADA